MKNECIPFFEAAYTQKLTVHAAVALTGKTFCGPLEGYQGNGPGLAADPLPANDGGNLIAGSPAAGGAVGGVVGWDVPKDGKAPIIRGAGTIVPVTAGAKVDIGDRLAVDTDGKVVPAVATNAVVGLAHSAAAAEDDEVAVELFGPGTYMDAGDNPS